MGDSSHRGQGCQAWTAVGPPPRYPHLAQNWIMCDLYLSIRLPTPDHQCWGLSSSGPMHILLLFIVLLLLLSLSLFALVSHYVLLICYATIRLLSRKCAIKPGISVTDRDHMPVFWYCLVTCDVMFRFRRLMVEVTLVTRAQMEQVCMCSVFCWGWAPGEGWGRCLDQGCEEVWLDRLWTSLTWKWTRSVMDGYNSPVADQCVLSDTGNLMWWSMTIHA